MAKSRRRRRSRSRSRSRRGRGFMQSLKGSTGVAALVARYITQVLKPGTWYPKTRQLMLDSFIYASLVAGEWRKRHPDDKPIQPKYGVHTYVKDQPAVTGGKDDQAMEAKPGKLSTGGRRRRSRKKRRKSRRKSKKRKSRRRRKKSRRRRRR